MKTKKKLPAAPKRITEKDAYATRGRIRKELDHLDTLRKMQQANLQQLAEDYFGLKPGDRVVYVGPDPKKFTTGVVRQVEGLATSESGYLGFVMVQPFDKGGFGDKLTTAEHMRKVFYKRGDLRLSQYGKPKVPKPVIAKFERTDWFNRKTEAVSYGIKARDSAGKRWMNVAEDGEPLLFNNPAARDTKLKELRAAARAKKP